MWDENVNFNINNIKLIITWFLKKHNQIKIFPINPHADGSDVAYAGEWSLWRLNERWLRRWNHFRSLQKWDLTAGSKWFHPQFLTILSGIFETWPHMTQNDPTWANLTLKVNFEKNLERIKTEKIMIFRFKIFETFYAEMSFANLKVKFKNLFWRFWCG